MRDSKYGIEIDDTVLAAMLEAVIALPDPSDPSFDSDVRNKFLQSWDSEWSSAWTELKDRTPEDDLEFELAETHVAEHASLSGLDEQTLLSIRLKLGLANLSWLAQAKYDDRYLVRLRTLKSEHFGNGVLELMELQYHCASTNPREIRRHLTRARELAAEPEYSSRFGLLHTVAELTAQLFEQIPDDDRTEEDEALIEHALSDLDHAMSLYRAEHQRDYPKYYYTLGRLRLLQHDYEPAKTAIREAMRLEDPSSSRALLRMSQYGILGSRIDHEERLHGHESTITTYRQRLDAIKGEYEMLDISIRDQAERQQGRMMEILGLMTAIIAFLVVATNTVLKVDDPQTMLVAVVGMAAAIVAVFATYRLLFVFDAMDARYALDLKRDSEGNVVLNADGEPERLQVNRFTPEDTQRQRRVNFSVIAGSVAVLLTLIVLIPLLDDSETTPGQEPAQAVSPVQPTAQ